MGQCLSEMIRGNKIHAITCTGANLEEDFFNLVAHNRLDVVFPMNRKVCRRRKKPSRAKSCMRCFHV